MSIVTAVAVVLFSFFFGWLIGIAREERRNKLIHVENERLKLRAVCTIPVPLEPSMDVRLKRANFCPVEK